MKESEFGRGLVICLVKFAEHFPNITWSEKQDWSVWANGASDHLYDIQVPKKWKDTELDRLVRELQDKGLDMGHGKGLLGNIKYTVKDIIELRDLTHKIALLIDQYSGLKKIADVGSW